MIFIRFLLPLGTVPLPEMNERQFMFYTNWEIHKQYLNEFEEIHSRSIFYSIISIRDIGVAKSPLITWIALCEISQFGKMDTTNDSSNRGA